MTSELTGIVPVIPMPFHSDESIDTETLKRAVDFAARRRMSAVCLPAYGSEFYKLNDRERESAVALAIEASDGRIPVIAQANHPSAEVAARIASRYQKLGADLISFALPRQFGVTESDLLEYCWRIAAAVDCPLLVQDFNPGGATVSADFIATAIDAYPNIRYFKLEEPLILDKLAQVNARVGKSVGILGGWGAYYMLESIAGGACGFMPGLAICDLLDRIYGLATKELKSAYSIFSSVLPYIAFSLQDFELFLQMEKRVLTRRGIFAGSLCRTPTRTLTLQVSDHVDFLIEQVMILLEREGMLHND